MLYDPTLFFFIGKPWETHGFEVTQAWETPSLLRKDMQKAPLSAPFVTRDPDSPALLRLGGCMKFTLSGGGAISPDVQVGKSSNCWGISRTQAMEKIHTHRRGRSFSPTHKPNTGYCLVVTGTMEFQWISYIVKNNPNWRTHIFQRGWNHQPEHVWFPRQEWVRTAFGCPLIQGYGWMLRDASQ